MVVDVLVPQMGESVLEGTVLEWKVKVGDRVELNQSLVELMTDKVNVEIPAESAGVLTGVFARDGDVVPVGTRIATIDDGLDGDAVEAAPPAAEEVAAEPAAPAAVPAPAPPEIKTTAPVGQGKMSPKVRMMIREYGLDPATIAPTGKKGQVTVADVLRAVDVRSAAAGFVAGPVPPAAPPVGPAPPEARPAVPPEPKVRVEIPVFEPLPANLRETRQPLVGVRKMIADHMTRSRDISAHVTTFEDIDMTELARFRRGAKESFMATYGANLTFMPFIIKAVTVALKEFPKMNASLTEKEIVLKNYYHIGVAVAREEGLIVPVIRDADRKTITELAVELADIGTRARNNQLLPDDVADGTFTITNAGMFGASASTPLINQPQVAILGVHAIMKRPWVIEDQIEVRDISTFGLSFDHRLIDGHTAVQFLHRVHGYLADTSRLLLNLR
ncbi:MAG TPA: dihydrolipoamide acetyltransferase family protein [Acidobacteriota bacterium]|nr:dihydrolipoamide acetyltransferase family protein [Acidobacteriota bacterium]